MVIKKIIYAAAISICALPAMRLGAQNPTLKKSDIPRLPLDTLPTDRGDVRLVTFTDGTFRFIPADVEQFWAQAPYTTCWDTVALFPHRGVEVPESVILPLTDDLATEFRAPIRGEVLSKYGPRRRRAHSGTDIRLDHGQPVVAAFDGVVRHSRWNSGGFGNLVVIRHPSGLETYYAHLSRRAARAGEWVRAGQVIGYGGRTGRATCNHLHFEVRYADQSFDPERLIDFASGRLRHTTFALRRDYFDIRSRATIEDPDMDEGLYAEADSLGGGSELLAEATEEATPPAAAQPVAPKVKPTAKPIYHTVKRGDTIYALSRRYSTTQAELCRRNGITPTTTLKIGRKLLVK